MSELGVIFIYVLKCPITKEIKYIGKANNIKKRLKSHLRDSKKRDTPVYRWIRELALLSVEPKIEPIFYATLDNWENHERRIIKEFKEKGYNLLNVAEGGGEPFCPKETRADNGRKNSKSIHSDPKKKRMWRARQTLASNLYWLERHDKHEKVLEVKIRLAKHGIFI